MKRTKQRLGIYTVLLFLLIAAVVATRTLALLWNFNFETGYFEDKLFSSVSDWLTVVGVLLSLSYFAVGRSARLRASFSSPAFYLPSGLLGVSLLFLAGDKLKAVFTGIYENLYLGFGAFKPELILPFAVAVSALLAVGYFVLAPFTAHRLYLKRAALGIAVAVFLALYTAYLYFDTTLPLNAPMKVGSEMAFVFSSAFFLFETRISLGRDKWGAYLGFGMAAMLLTAAASVPALIIYLSEGRLVAESLTETVLLLSLFIFTSARVLHTLALRVDGKAPLAALAEKMTEREDTVAESSDTAEEKSDDEGVDEPDNYTMTFDEGEAKEI